VRMLVILLAACRSAVAAGALIDEVGFAATATSMSAAGLALCWGSPYLAAVCGTSTRRQRQMIPGSAASHNMAAISGGYWICVWRRGQLGFDLREAGTTEGSYGKDSLGGFTHPGDFVWRAGGSIALHAKKGYRVKIVCRGVRRAWGISVPSWKQPGMTLERSRPAARRFGPRGGGAGAESSFFDAGPTIRCPERGAYGPPDRHLPRADPSFVRTHSLMIPTTSIIRPAAAYAQRRVSWRRDGPKPQGDYATPRRRCFCSSRTTEMFNFKPSGHSQHDEVVGYQAQNVSSPSRAKTFVGVLRAGGAAVGGMQGGRNSGQGHTYGEPINGYSPVAWRTLVPRFEVPTLGAASSSGNFKSKRAPE